LLVPTYPLPYHSEAWILGACLLAILATILRGWALITLRQLFDRDADILPDHQLLEHGPYRFVQHPAYAANILVAAATGVVAIVAPYRASLLAAVVRSFADN
jgi:protein-S-isoprenylcysteine O-methyltransferase Ste14